MLILCLCQVYCEGNSCEGIEGKYGMKLLEIAHARVPGAEA